MLLLLAPDSWCTSMSVVGGQAWLGLTGHCRGSYLAGGLASVLSLRTESPDYSTSCIGQDILALIFEDSLTYTLNFLGEI